jgi:DNA-binding transcriptional ArsR family regulator
MKFKIQFVERSPAPALLPILRSRQQGEILTWLLDDPDREASLAELSHRLDVPISSVHREVQRAEQAGLVASRRVGKTRIVRANKQSRFLAPLRQLLVMSFGVPDRLAEALRDIRGVDAAYIFGSWAARYMNQAGARPVGDVDLLVLGDPDRDMVYTRVAEAEPELGYPIQVTFRPSDWLTTGSDSFHDTVVSRYDSPSTRAAVPLKSSLARAGQSPPLPPCHPERARTCLVPRTYGPTARPAPHPRTNPIAAHVLAY